MDGDFVPAILIPLFIIFAIGIGIFAYIQSEKRKKMLREWAQSKGLQFSPDSDRTFDDSFPAFGCLRRGHSRIAYNLVWGPYHNRHLTVFDYRYKTGSGKHQQTHRFTGAMINAGITMPYLAIRREHFFDKVAEFAGFDDIDFEWKEFSDAFHVKSNDKKFAYDVVNSSSMEFLMKIPDFKLEFAGRMILCYADKTLDLDGIESLIHVIEGLIERFPADLKQGAKA